VIEPAQTAPRSAVGSDVVIAPRSAVGSDVVIEPIDSSDNLSASDIFNAEHNHFIRMDHVANPDVDTLVSQFQPTLNLSAGKLSELEQEAKSFVYLTFGGVGCSADNSSCAKTKKDLKEAQIVLEEFKAKVKVIFL
jgi:hypothetical protein